MKKKDKELLLKDLCERLPYGVKATTTSNGWNGIYTITGYANDRIYLDCPVYDNGDDEWLVESVKHYLRPMSSMTDKELDTLWSIWEDNTASEAASKMTDFLNKRHLDHHHLIDKGLALEALKGMYK